MSKPLIETVSSQSTQFQ